MGQPRGSGDSDQPLEESHTVHLVLREGFRGHKVVVTLNERRVYDAVDVTTDPLTARAGAVAVSGATRRARLAVSVTPGALAAAVDVDVAMHPYVAISLIGEGTVALETSAVPFHAFGGP
jgi:hypothetical protein